MKLTLTLMAVTFVRMVIAAPEDAKSDPFCQDIFHIFDERASGFESLKGAYRDDTDYWVSSVQLPGARNCYIKHWSFNDEHVCTWRLASRAEAYSSAVTIATKLRWCLRVGRNIDSGPLSNEADDKADFSDRLPIIRPNVDFFVKSGASATGRGSLSFTVRYRGD